MRLFIVHLSQQLFGVTAQIDQDRETKIVDDPTGGRAPAGSQDAQVLWYPDVAAMHIGPPERNASDVCSPQ